MPERKKAIINRLEQASDGYSFAAESARRRSFTNTTPVGNTTAPPENNAEPKTQQEEVQEKVSDLQGKLATLRDKVTVAEDVADAPDVTVVDPRIGTDSSERIINQSPAGMMALLEEQRQGEMERMREDLDASKTEREGLADKLRGVFRDRPSVKETVRQERDALGVGFMLEQQQQTLNNIHNLQTRAISLIEQRDAAIGMAGQQAISTPFITGHQNRIAENYDRRIATISEQIGASSAYLQAQHGQVEQARGLISDIVDAQTYDTQMELEKMNMFLELNRDEISMLDKEYQRELLDSQRYWEDRFNTEKEERRAVLELMVQYPDAAVSANDSLEEAIRKTSKYTGAQIDSDIKELMVNYPTAGITEEDSFASAITKIAQMPQTPVKPETFGGQSTGYYTWEYDDATGQWRTKQVVGPQPGKTTMVGGEPLSLVDIKRYNDMYEGVNIMPHDTREIADAKVFLEYEVKPMFREFRNEGYSIEEVERFFTEENGRELSPQEAHALQSVFLEEGEEGWLESTLKRPFRGIWQTVGDVASLFDSGEKQKETQITLDDEE